MDGGAPLGDIWSTGAFSFESPLKDLLDTGTYTLEQLLAEDELLQELRGMHPQLMEFFSNEEVVMKLIQHVIRPKGSACDKEEEEKVLLETPLTAVAAPDKEEKKQGSDDDDAEEEEEEPQEKTKKTGQWLFPPPEEPTPPPSRSAQEEQDLRDIRYPYMSCEVLCCEITTIIDKLVNGHVTNEHVSSSNRSGRTDPRPEPLLDLFFSLLYETPPGELDDYRAGYFDKILSVLFRKCPQAMSTYINEGGGRGPVVLMEAMMKHLYSHSIMQIVQRLLLPQPSNFSKEDEEGDEDEDEDDSDNNEEDDMGAFFRCRWSESTEAVDMLLKSLIVPTTKPITELRLEEAQNASEVLITVIQNSPLTSANILSLTSNPVLEQIIQSASILREGEDFSPHDSSLTCAMNVLESLVLQLGGYGTVGTPIPEEDDQSLEMNELANGERTTPVPENEEKPPKRSLMADADTLVLLLPGLMERLSSLLRHPSTATWLSPMQFSKQEPQKLLGMSRLRIVRLLESLVLLGNSDVDKVLCESECLSICLDLFWEFQWCSMLHQSVANLLVHVFEGANERGDLQEYFMVKCDLLRRLMDAFEPEGEDDSSVMQEDRLTDEAVLAMKELGSGPTPPSIASEPASTQSIDAVLGDGDDVIPVSDDDVDAALEQGAAAITISEDEDEPLDEEIPPPQSIESVDEVAPDVTVTAETNSQEEADVQSHIPSLRLGNMGHVIIICQALVHACTSGLGDSAGDLDEPSEPGMATIDLEAADESINMTGGDELFTLGERKKSSLESLDFDQDDSDTYDEDAANTEVENTLIIAQLIETSPLKSKWDEFIATTLATETAIQSTPLGGFNTGNSDPLHSHSPALNGLARFPDEGEGQPPGTGKGLLVSGDVIDMDDNDLDIAASMMEKALSDISKRVVGADDGIDSPSGIHTLPNNDANSHEYIFDDPLGRSPFSRSDSGDEEDTSEPTDNGEIVATTSQEKEEECEVPVMDLFAGNFSFGKEFDIKEVDTELTHTDAPSPTEGTWSNFANFDDAFASAGNLSGPDSEEPGALAAADTEVNASSPVVVEEELPKSDVDDIFGSSPTHHLLLVEDDAVAQSLADSTKNDGSTNNEAEASIEESQDSESEDPAAHDVSVDTEHVEGSETGVISEPQEETVTISS